MNRTKVVIHGSTGSPKPKEVTPQAPLKFSPVVRTPHSMIEAVANEINQESGDGMGPDSEFFGTVDHPLSRKFKTSTSNQDLVFDSKQGERSKSREAEV